ncbi:MAG TPA: GatB/YqeY domain-containing protein [Stellaceae bacterium]|nr:GatB/YqeY domain-containing protein [Stellaceae bacterium]
MLREAFAERLKEAMRSRDARTVATVRLILAALKDRDIAQRGTASPDPLADPDILRMLQGMIKQRRESIALYEQGKRPELAAKEQGEIDVIETFLPRQMGDTEIEAAVTAAIAEIGATGIKDMGKVMGALRERHSGVLDMAKAGAVVKRLLG